MINEEQVKRYCSESLDLIENYDKAVEDTTQTWDCHHRWETMFGYSRKELIEAGAYYNVPASHLIFMTSVEHNRLHRMCDNLCGERNPFYGKKHTELTKMILSELKTGEKNPNFGKMNATSSKSVLQFTKTGEFVKEWPSVSEINRQLGYNISSISHCCLGRIKTSHNYIWKYKEN